MRLPTHLLYKGNPMNTNKLHIEEGVNQVDTNEAGAGPQAIVDPTNVAAAEQTQVNNPGAEQTS